MRILGVDTIEFGIDVENYDSVFFDFLFKFEELKKLSQLELKEQVININGLNLLVNRKGQGFYRYKLQCQDFYICFMQYDIKNSSPIYVRFMSEFIWKYGYEECYSIFCEWFEVFGIKIKGTRLSRLDICFDTEEISFSVNDKNKFVTRARKVDVHYLEENVSVDSEHYIGKNFSGFVIGRGSPLSCRIYNKSLEIRNRKTWFYSIWEQNNYNSQNDVWRVEFQCRRKVLKELQINTYEDISKHLKETWAYYTQKWLILKGKENNNVSRCQIIDKWLIVQCGGESYIPSPAIRNIIKKGNMEKLLCQCYGLFISIAALKGTNIRDTYLVLVEYVKTKNEVNHTSFEKEVQKRKDRFI